MLIQRGERAPDFALPRGGGPVRFYSLVGGTSSVLVLAAGAAPDLLRELTARLRGDLDGSPVHVVVPGGGADGDDVFSDPEGRVHESYGVPVDGPPMVLVLDPGVRVVAPHPVEEVAATVAAVSSQAARARHPESAAVVSRQAPVLLVPDVLDHEWCERLTQRWATSAEETGVETSSEDGRHEVTDHHRKRRRDHTVTDPELLRELTGAVGRRVMPELQHAFAYRATRFEGFKIGCYEARSQGFFEAHRDNLSPATAHRRFALTLNLNADYEGGELRFPEYGRERYRPGAGGALLFSGSLLHEVLPVTRGRRFVLLSFLFESARQRSR